MKTEWTNKDDGSILINNVEFELIGEAYPENDEFGDVFICHNYENGNGDTAKTWHPVTDIDAYNEGNLDCCDWENWNSTIVEVHNI